MAVETAATQKSDILPHVQNSPIIHKENGVLSPEGSKTASSILALTAVKVGNSRHTASILCNSDADHINELYSIEFVHEKSGVRKVWEVCDLVSVRPAGLADCNPIRLTATGALKAPVVQDSKVYTVANPRKLYLYFVTRKQCKLRLRQIAMVFEERSNDNETTITDWIHLLEEILDKSIKTQNRPEKLLVYVNPYGGIGKAKQIFSSKVCPVLQLANVKYEVVETQAADHAKNDVANRNDLDTFDGIVSVGGDGMYNEVMTGLVMRAQNATARPFSACQLESRLNKPHMRIGIIPAGSLNALCWSVHGTDDPLTSTLHIILGHCRGVDACGVYEGKHLTRLASAMVAFAYLGDALRISEKMRRFGPFRYKVAGARAVWENRQYAGRLDMQVVYDNGLDTVDKMKRAFKDLRHLKTEACRVDCLSCSSKSSESEQLSCDADPIVYNTSVCGTFSHIVGAVTKCQSKMTPSGLSPKTHLGDGYLDVGVVGRMSLLRNTLFVNLTTVKGAKHMKFAETQVFRVKAFSFTPYRQDCGFTGTMSNAQDMGYGLKLSQNVDHNANDQNDADLQDASLLQVMSDQTQRGTWNIDGELMILPKETVHFRIHQQLLKVFGEGIPLSQKTARRSKFGCISKHISPAVDYT